MKEFVIAHEGLARLYEAKDARAAVAKHREWMKGQGISSAEVKVFVLDLEATLELGKINASRIPS
tara:strand:+ start:403 stop:597 length:195 start_codon:yes stop_codon:yes gene_type:complete